MIIIYMDIDIDITNQILHIHAGHTAVRVLVATGILGKEKPGANRVGRSRGEE
jgi:hypothetical protein